jgi:TetR/AcrR family transcriptional regulator, cholesterol catabolism regulator
VKDVTVDEVTVMPAYKRVRRETILEAAERLLDDCLYDDSQMREVADAADVALGTLYKYFRSKEMLYVEVLHRWAAWEEPSTAPAASPTKKLRTKLNLIIDNVEERPNLFLVEHSLQMSTDPVVQARRQTWSDAGARWLVHDLDALGDERAAHVAVIVWAVINHVLVRSTVHGQSFAEARATADELLNMLDQQPDSATSSLHERTKTDQ